MTSSLVAPSPAPVYRIVCGPHAGRLVLADETQPCGACHGTGREWGRWSVPRPKCGTCRGSGRIVGADPFVWPTPVEPAETYDMEDTPQGAPCAPGRARGPRFRPSTDDSPRRSPRPGASCTVGRTHAAALRRSTQACLTDSGRDLAGHVRNGA